MDWMFKGKKGRETAANKATVLYLGILSWIMLILCSSINYLIYTYCTIYAGHSRAANCITTEQLVVHDILQFGGRRYSLWYPIQYVYASLLHLHIPNCSNSPSCNNCISRVLFSSTCINIRWNNIHKISGRPFEQVKSKIKNDYANIQLTSWKVLLATFFSSPDMVLFSVRILFSQFSAHPKKIQGYSDIHTSQFPCSSDQSLAGSTTSTSRSSTEFFSPAPLHHAGQTPEFNLSFDFLFDKF
jgi:hypothetical protein